MPRYLLVILLILGIALVALWLFPIRGCGSDRDPCAMPIKVYSADGTPLAVTAVRCDQADGRHPGLAIWAPRARDMARWRERFVGFSSAGRGLWFVEPATGWGDQRSDQFWDDLAALVEALTDEHWTDPGRIALVVHDEQATARLESAPPDVPLSGVAALVWVHGGSWDEGWSTTISSGPLFAIEPSAAEAGRALDWLADELATPVNVRPRQASAP